MNWLRDTLKKHRAFVLAFLLVETFYWAEGLQFVYAHEIREQEREVHFQKLSELLGIPVEKLHGERRSLFDPLEELVGDVSSSVGVTLDDLSSTLRRQARRAKSEASRLSDRLDDLLAAPVPAAPAEPAAFLGSPQTAEAPAGSKLQPVPRTPQEGAARERTVRAPGAEPKRLPLRQVERKARTEKAGTSARSVRSSAVAPASVPRQVLPKDGVAPEIAALAASLDNSPAEIFRFVHDKIDFDPKWGAEKSPLGTLYERQGTSWDQAWLLQQLLTAAGVDARLEWGEIEIPAEMLRNIAGVEDPWRAGDLMTTAGTPIVLVVEGSQVKTARMSHVWVKAYLDYFPNRGVTPGPGDTWIRMDPSLKRIAITGDLRLDAAVPYDLGEYLRSGTELSPRQFYEAGLDAYITANHPEVSSLEELKRTKSVVEEAFPFVPGTLRGKILSVQGESVEMPEAFQQKLKLEVREVGGPVLATYETAWPAVYGQRLDLAWLGATSSDQATLDLYGGVFSTPPFEVDLKPSIRVEGVEVAAGSAIGSAEDVVVQATWTTPQGLETVVPFEMWAGEPGVLSLDFGRTPQETIDRYTQELSAATDPAEQETLRLALAAAQYQRSLGGDLAHLADLRWQRVLNLGRTVLAVQRGAVSVSSDGTPLTFSRGPTALDLGSMPLGLFPSEGGTVSTVPAMELLGSQGSFLEGEALSQVFGGDHVTGVTFLTRAVREGQTLTRVDAANVDEALGAVELSAEAEASVRAGVEDGFVAWIPESQLPVDTFDATGYVVEDPATGAAGYFVTYERVVQGLAANIVFHSPQDLDVVTAPVDILATIESEALESWTLSYQMAGEGPAVVLATGVGSVTNATLAELDPTLLLNGLYDLVLTGKDIAGQTASGKISVVVEGGMKIGYFTMSFTDLAVPLAGLDIQVIRTYDSRDKRQGDFGTGWSLDIRQGSYRNNRPPGDGWQFDTGFLPCDSIIERKSHLTTVRLSDREIYRFRLKLGSAAPTFGGCFAQASFEYVDGPLPGSTLEILGSTEVFYANKSDRVVHPSTQELYVPQDVRLTTRDGRIFHLNLGSGVTHLEDLNGNTLEITPLGIAHSSGQGVEFARDDVGRIEKIIDPSSREILYTYDKSGDLVSMTDRTGVVTQYSYEGDHYLSDIINAKGVRAVRTEYDEDGRMIRTIDADGKATIFLHDLDARREVVTNRLGYSRVLEYDTQGNLIRETDENGKVTTRTFDVASNLLTMTDPLNRMVRYEYSGSGDLTKLTDPLGNETLLTYNDRGQVLTLEDPQGRVATSIYDSRGNLLQATDHLGNTTGFSYGSRGLLLSTTDALGGVTRYAYDGNGNRIEEIDTLGGKTTWTYDANGNRLAELRTRTLPDGTLETLTQSWTYDELDRVISTVEADGTSVHTTYGLLGEVLSRTDELGRTTTFTYDQRGQVTSVLYPDGTSEGRSYDDIGRMVARTDRSGHQTSFIYDAAGRLTTTIYPDGATTNDTYDDASQLVATSGDDGFATYAYDLAGRRTRVTDALGNTTSFTYDEVGNRLSATDPKGYMTTFGYDDFDNLVKTTYPDGSTTQASYDVLGRRTSVTDQAGLETFFAYDKLSRLVSVTDAMGSVTSYTYDEIGNLQSLTDGNGNVTSFEYDSRGRRTKRAMPDGSSEFMTYTVDGMLASHTDFNGATKRYTYDENRYLLSRSYPDGSKDIFSYTVGGRLASAVDGRGTTSYSYDERNRLLAKMEPNGHELRYTYDDSGNRASLTAVIGSQTLTTTYTYDALRRLSTVTDPQGQVYSYVYDANGNRASLTYPNGVVTTYTYDSLNRLTDLTTRSAGGEVIQAYAYTLASTGHRARIDEPDGVYTEYSYDQAHRLTSESVGSGAETSYSSIFSYDGVGNRIRQVSEQPSVVDANVYTYDSRDRLLTQDGDTFSWDANGNLLGRTGNESASFSWDFENRLMSATRVDGPTVTYGYDVTGSRAHSIVHGSSGEPSIQTDYLVDSAGVLSQTIVESDEMGNVLAYYVHGDDLLAVIFPGATSYFHADGLGSARVLTNASGEVTDRYRFSAFGELIEHDGTSPNAYLFAGESLDPNAGLYYLRARWMDPELGRFLSEDPLMGVIRDPMSLHRYLYASVDPVNRSDPRGRQTSSAGLSAAMSIASTLASIAVRVAGFALLGAGFGLVDAWLGDEPLWPAAKAGAITGAGIGLFWPFRYWRIFVRWLIIFSGGAGAIHSFKEGKTLQGVFRIGIVLFVAKSSLGRVKPPTIRRADPSGIQQIFLHLQGRFAAADEPPNAAMLERLRIGEWDFADQEFYRHELFEAELMDQGLPYRIAHRLALQEFGVTEFDLYHPEVLTAFPEYFNSNWFAHWHISPP